MWALYVWEDGAPIIRSILREPEAAAREQANKREGSLILLPTVDVYDFRGYVLDWESR